MERREAFILNRVLNIFSFYFSFAKEGYSAVLEHHKASHVYEANKAIKQKDALVPTGDVCEFT